MKTIEEIKLVITKTEHGTTVYEDNTKTRIDMFSNDDEGFDRLMNFVAKYLSQPVKTPLK